MSNLYRNLDLAEVAGKVRLFTTNLQDFKMVTPSLARVCVTISGNVPPRDQVRASIVDLFKGHAAPVQNSFRQLTTAGHMQVVVGFVKTLHEVRDLDAATQKGMKAMASNLLMDEQDKSLWEIRKGASGTQYIVKQGDEDLSELATSLYSRKAGLPTLANIQDEPASSKEFAAFVDIASEELQYGFVVSSEGDKMTVIAHGEDEAKEISTVQLVQVAHMDADDYKKAGVEMAASGMDRSAMVEYYKKLYGYSPEYVQEIIDMIDQHAFA